MVKHAFKEANCYVDRLASLGLERDLGVHWLAAPLRDLIWLLQADLTGVSLPCICPFV